VEGELNLNTTHRGVVLILLSREESYLQVESSYERRDSSISLVLLSMLLVIYFVNKPLSIFLFLKLSACIDFPKCYANPSVRGTYSIMDY
jgi:hypothetical protein